MARSYIRFSKIDKVSKDFVKKNKKSPALSNLRFGPFFDLQMTSKLKFDLICPHTVFFGGALDFQFLIFLCLSTAWTFNLQCTSFWVVFSELVTARNIFRSGFLEFDDISKLLQWLCATRSSRGQTKKNPYPNNNNNNNSEYYLACWLSPQVKLECENTKYKAEEEKWYSSNQGIITTATIATATIDTSATMATLIMELKSTSAADRPNCFLLLIS